MNAIRLALTLLAAVVATPAGGEEGDCPDPTGASCGKLCWTALDQFESLYGPVSRGETRDIWRRVHEDFRKWRWCHENSADEGIPNFLQTLLAEHWEEAPQFVSISKGDRRFFQWVVKGFGDLGDPERYRRIARHAMERCPEGASLLCARLRTSALVGAGQAEAWRATAYGEKPFLGVVEEQEGEIQARFLFRRSGPDWVAFPDPAPDIASLHKFADLPRSMHWTICFDGKKRGMLDSELTVTKLYARAGVHVPLEGQAVPFPALRSAEFSGWPGGAVLHPMALSPLGHCSDPDGWMRDQPTSALVRKLVAAVQAATRAELCEGEDKTKVTRAWVPRPADVRLLKAYRSKSGEWIAALQARMPDEICDGIDDEQTFASQLFRVTAQGEVVRLGAGLSVVDAGDYDGDGRSEILVKFARYNNDGYTMFYEGFSKSVSYGWNYH